MSNIIEKADAFADKAHAGHTNSNKSRTPYINHLREVAGLVKESGGSDEEITAALLHDSVEDTETTLEDIKLGFGHEVALMVDALTDAPEIESLPTLERKTIQAERVRTKNSSIKRIKLSDQISNVRGVAIDPPMKWSREKCSDYIEGARRIAEECKGISEFLDGQFADAYVQAIKIYPKI